MTDYLSLQHFLRSRWSGRSSNASTQLRLTRHPRRSRYSRGTDHDRKTVTLIGENGAEIRGNGSGKVVTIAADNVTHARFANHRLRIAIIR